MASVSFHLRSKPITSPSMDVYRHIHLSGEGYVTFEYGDDTIALHGLKPADVDKLADLFATAARVIADGVAEQQKDVTATPLDVPA